tara:strand:- start:56 stop:295 length:240 start_codon:yes stop_codon:yes gene_type:complete
MVNVMRAQFENLIILEVSFPKGKIQVNLSDGRSVALPLSWFPKLEKADQVSLSDFELSPHGHGIHWPKIDEDISIKAFI